MDVLGELNDARIAGAVAMVLGLLAAALGAAGVVGTMVRPRRLWSHLASGALVLVLALGIVGAASVRAYQSVAELGLAAAAEYEVIFRALPEAYGEVGAPGRVALICGLLPLALGVLALVLPYGVAPRTVRFTDTAVGMAFGGLACASLLAAGRGFFFTEAAGEAALDRYAIMATGKILSEANCDTCAALEDLAAERPMAELAERVPGAAIRARVCVTEWLAEIEARGARERGRSCPRYDLDGEPLVGPRDSEDRSTEGRVALEGDLSAYARLLKSPLVFDAQLRKQVLEARDRATRRGAAPPRVTPPAVAPPPAMTNPVRPGLPPAN